MLEPLKGFFESDSWVIIKMIAAAIEIGLLLQDKKYTVGIHLLSNEQVMQLN